MSDKKRNSKNSKRHPKREGRVRRKTEQSDISLECTTLSKCGFEDNIRWAKENACYRHLKSFNWATLEERDITDVSSNFSDEFFVRQSRVSKSANVLNLGRKLYEFKREKEYMRRMLLGGYIDIKESGAKRFLMIQCKHCWESRHRHYRGLCPSLRKGKTGPHPRGMKPTQDHYFVYDKYITPIVIETLVLEGFDIKKKFRLPLKGL